MAESSPVVGVENLEPGVYDTVFVSPHLDDVAFSCPGALHSLRKSGRKVLVIVVFSHAGDDAEAERIYEYRRAEECRAAMRGGYDLVWGHFVDAPFRPWPHRNFMEIIWGESPKDEEIVNTIKEWLRKVIGHVRPRQVVGPLGVGRHIDHRLSYRALRQISNGQGELDLWYYEERPYALIDGAVAMRLAEMGYKAEVRLEEFWRLYSKAAYVVNHLVSRQDRDRCRQNFAELHRKGQAARNDVTPGATARLIETEDCASIWKIVEAHRSQVEAFLGDMDRFRRECGDYTRCIKSDAKYAERQWRL